MYRIIPTKQFQADVEYYVKKYHFHHIGEDIQAVTDELKCGNLIGDEIPNLKIESDGHTYKVRAANTDVRAGKSNGYRIIYYVVKDDEEIYLLTIYYKKESQPTKK